MAPGLELVAVEHGGRGRHEDGFAVEGGTREKSRGGEGSPGIATYDRRPPPGFIIPGGFDKGERGPIVEIRIVDFSRGRARTSPDAAPVKAKRAVSRIACRECNLGRNRRFHAAAHQRMRSGHHGAAARPVLATSREP